MRRARFDGTPPIAEHSLEGHEREEAVYRRGGRPHGRGQALSRRAGPDRVRLGGSEHLSEAQRQLSRRASLLSVQCELVEADAILGKEIDLDAYGMMTDRLGRAFTRLGIKRAAREVTLDPILAHFSRPPERAAS